MRKQANLFNRQNRRRIVAGILCMALAVPLAVHGIPLTDAVYSDVRIAPSWDPAQYGPQKTNQEKYKETGLAFNWTSFPRYNQAGNLFPYAANGKTNPKFNFLMLAIACGNPSWRVIITAAWA